MNSWNGTCSTAITKALDLVKLQKAAGVLLAGSSVKFDSVICHTEKTKLLRDVISESGESIYSSLVVMGYDGIVDEIRSSKPRAKKRRTQKKWAKKLIKIVPSSKVYLLASKQIEDSWLKDTFRQRFIGEPFDEQTKIAEK